MYISDPPSADWVNRTYREEPYGAVGTIDFIPAITARHVAVYCLCPTALALAEVEVYGKFISNNALELGEISLKTGSISFSYGGFD